MFQGCFRLKVQKFFTGNHLNYNSNNVYHLVYESDPQNTRWESFSNGMLHGSVCFMKCANSQHF